MIMLLKGLFISLQFFTSIPIRWVFPIDEEHLKHAVNAFPLLGLFQGLFYSFLVFSLTEWTPFSILASAFILWVSTLILTGGIHLDGWMDASDAYFSYQPIEKRLEIMKDPRTGAFGVLSVIVLLSAKFLFIFEINTKLTVTSYFMIVLIPFISKSMMGLLLVTVEPAKHKGLAALFRYAANIKCLYIYLIYFVILLVSMWLIEESIIGPAFVLLAGSIGLYFFVREKIIKWFNGITGDVLGAVVEGVEVSLWMTLWLLHYFVMV